MSIDFKYTVVFQFIFIWVQLCNSEFASVFQVQTNFMPP